MVNVDIKKLELMLKSAGEDSERTRGMVATLIAFVALLPGAKQVDFQELGDLVGQLMPQASSAMRTGATTAMEGLRAGAKYRP